jgi:hypothetical protein
MMTLELSVSEASSLLTTLESSFTNIKGLYYWPLFTRLNILITSTVSWLTPQLYLKIVQLYTFFVRAMIFSTTTFGVMTLTIASLISTLSILTLNTQYSA